MEYKLFTLNSRKHQHRYYIYAFGFANADQLNGKKQTKKQDICANDDKEVKKRNTNIVQLNPKKRAKYQRGKALAWAKADY